MLVVEKSSFYFSFSMANSYFCLKFNYMNRSEKWIYAWLLSGCLLIFFMVFLGGATRLTHSGLSMVDWSLFGSLPPSNENAWQDLFDKYKQFPEYQQINFNFSVDEFKSIFWWEYIHRMTGRFMGLLFILPFLFFLFTKKIRGVLLWQLCGLLFLGGLQGFIGWYMVKSGLVNNPDVSHYRLALHLITAFITFAFTFYIALRLQFKNLSLPNYPSYKKWLWVHLLVLLLQIVYGAFVAGLDAGMVYNTWPKMGDAWIHEGVTAMQPFLHNFTEGLAGVQFLHRYIAYVLLAIGIFLFVKARKSSLERPLRQAINILLATLLVQFALGVFTLLYAVPISLGVLHQLGAFILLGANVYALARFTPANP